MVWQCGCVWVAVARQSSVDGRQLAVVVEVEVREYPKRCTSATNPVALFRLRSTTLVPPKGPSQTHSTLTALWNTYTNTRDTVSHWDSPLCLLVGCCRRFVVSFASRRPANYYLPSGCLAFPQLTVAFPAPNYCCCQLFSIITRSLIPTLGRQFPIQLNLFVPTKKNDWGLCLLWSTLFTHAQVFVYEKVHHLGTRAVRSRWCRVWFYRKSVLRHPGMVKAKGSH